MAKRPIPDIVISRLPKYLQTLHQIKDENIYTISSTELGERIGISAAQLRKDLSHFGEFGKQGTGYNINILIEELESILKVDRPWNIVIVGAGDLGSALARYQGFSRFGYNILNIFDNDPEKIGKRIGNFIVEDSNKMSKRVALSNVKIAMITVPASVAQQVTDQLISAGVQAFLNYAPIILHVPDGIRVQYIDPIRQIQRMTYYL